MGKDGGIDRILKIDQMNEQLYGLNNGCRLDRWVVSRIEALMNS